jgi:RHS repeat-associated protein
MILEAWGTNQRRRFVFGPGTDELIVNIYADPNLTGRSWFHTDERGSSIALSDDNGASGTRGRYDEYGVGNGLSRFHYTGQLWLGDGDLHYYRARVYDAKLGRFLQPDPIGFGGGMNMYAYVGGDPVNATDPLGLCVDGACDIFIDAHDYGSPGIGGSSAGGFTGGGLPARLHYAGLIGPCQVGEICGTVTAASLPEDGKLCPPVAFTITGVGPGQAEGPARTSISQEPGNMINPRAGGVAIDPTDFGVADVRGQRREIFSNMRLYPDWNNAFGPSYVPAVPPGLPAAGPYRPIDVIPKDQRHPGNQIDLYRYSSRKDAFRSTRWVPIRVFIPANQAGIRCPGL